MTYTVYTYKQAVEQERQDFSSLEEALKFLGHQDLSTDVDQCVVECVGQELFNLSRNEHGWLSSD